jgi:hypothetical protein
MRVGAFEARRLLLPSNLESLSGSLDSPSMRIGDAVVIVAAMEAKVQIP